MQRTCNAGSIVLGSCIAAPGARWAQQKFPLKPVRLITSATPTEHEKKLRADIELFANIIKETGLKAK